MTVDLGRYGVWGHARALPAERARELESLGFGALWQGGSPGADLQHVRDLLEATKTIAIATGIVNIWTANATTVAASYHQIEAAYPGRFLLGVGVGHPEANAEYRSPYQALVDYLDVLDGEGIPVQRRVLAALGPKVLRLARDRSAGAHPYLVTPDHTRSARAILGPDRLLAPEQRVVLETDPNAARAVGRPTVVKPYLGLTNYTNNLRRLGYTDTDLSGEGSDRLIDDLVVYGNNASVAHRLGQHLDAGADHVAIQLLSSPEADQDAQYRTLADTLFA